MHAYIPCLFSLFYISFYDEDKREYCIEEMLITYYLLHCRGNVGLFFAWCVLEQRYLNRLLIS